jgi:UDP-galactopyranose mutase
VTRPILVVGAGFAGACYARVLADGGFDVEVIDQRDHIGGNAFDEIDGNGVRVHRYGPHLFHTNNARVFAWLQQFGAWIPYEHRVRAKLEDGRLVPLPVNLATLRAVSGLPLADAAAARAYLQSVARPSSAADAAAYLEARIGPALTDLFFGRYTRKMWGMRLENMDAAVVKRVDIRLDEDDRYFPGDRIQVLPRDGYTALFRALFDHRRIRVSLGRAFRRDMLPRYRHVFAAMPIDAYFDFAEGELPYRSIRFHHRTGPARDGQTWAVTNFTDTGARTRETAWHLLPGHRLEETGRCTYTDEEPCDYRDNGMERYYPVKTADRRYEAIYARYRQRAEAEPAISFIGRCGTYQYLDMHQVISQSLHGAQTWVAERLGDLRGYEALPSMEKACP